MDNATFTADVIARLLEKLVINPVALAHYDSLQGVKASMEQNQTTNPAEPNQPAPAVTQPAPVIAQTEPETVIHAPAVTQAAPARFYNCEPRPGDDFADVNVALEFLRHNVSRPLKNQFSEELEFSWSDFPALLDHIKPIVCDARLMWFQNWGKDENDVRCVKTQWIHVPSKTETWTIYYPENAKLPTAGHHDMLRAAAEETFHFRRAMYAALGIRPGDDEEDVKVQKQRHFKQKALAEKANDVRPWRANASKRTKEESIVNVLVASGRVTDPRIVAEAKSKNPDLTTPEDEEVIESVQGLPEVSARALFWLRQICSMTEEFRYYLDDPRATSADLPRQLWLRACQQAALEHLGGETDPTIPTEPAEIAFPEVKTYPAPAGMEHVKRTWDAYTLKEHEREMCNQLNKCRLLMAKKIPNAEMLKTLEDTKRRCDTATCAVIDTFIDQVNARPDYVPRKRKTAPAEALPVVSPAPVPAPEDRVPMPLEKENFDAWDRLRHKSRMAVILDELMVFAASWLPSEYKLAELRRHRDRDDIDYPTREGIDKLINGIENKDTLAQEYWRNRRLAADDDYYVANAVQRVAPVEGTKPLSTLADAEEDNDDDIAFIMSAEDPDACTPEVAEQQEKKQRAKADRHSKKRDAVSPAATAENPVLTLCQNAINTYSEGDDPESVVEFLLACRSHTDATTAASITVMINDFSFTTSLSKPPIEIDDDDMPY